MINKFDVGKLEDAINYKFVNKELAYMALTHSSYANEKKDKRTSNYERLEFLGDSIVSLIVSEYLYNNYPDFPEGELTKVRAIVVCEPTFFNCCKNMNIGQFLLLGKGEEMTGGRERISILADIFEAITAAIYLDSGYEMSKKFVLTHLNDVITDAISGIAFMDYKTQLQEVLQKNSSASIKYIIVNETGPDHDKRFEVQVLNGEKMLGTGIGKSKKEAEQVAAKEAIQKLGKS